MERKCWILDIGGGQHAAVSERELLHLIHEPELLEVPKTPSHCRHVLLWQKQLLPVMDLGVWLNSVRTEPIEARTAGMNQNFLKSANSSRFAGILGYQTERGGEPKFGALLLAAPPQRGVARDDDACALPQEPSRWHEIAASCFDPGNGAVPILDVAALFSIPR